MFITGRTKDGSDAVIPKGVYMSPDGTEWSSEPYTKEQRAQDSMYKEIINHLEYHSRSIFDEYNLIMSGDSKLSKRCRDYVIQLVNNNK